MSIAEFRTLSREEFEDRVKLVYETIHDYNLSNFFDRGESNRFITIHGMIWDLWTVDNQEVYDVLADTPLGKKVNWTKLVVYILFFERDETICLRTAHS